MAPRGSKEPQWTDWAWSDRDQKYKTELKDHKGTVIDTVFKEVPRYSPQDNQTSSASYVDPPVVTSPTTGNYSYGTSTGQGPTGYPNPSTANNYPGQNAPSAWTAPSGLPGPYPSSRAQPITYSYQPVSVSSGAPPLQGRNTTSSGWPALETIRRQYQDPPVQSAPGYVQGSYDDSRRRTAYPGVQPQPEAPFGGADTTTSNFGARRNVPMTPVTRPAAPYQSRGQPQNWPPEQDDFVSTRPTASSRPIREVTVSEYQDVNPRSDGRTAPSGFMMNTVMPNRSSHFPGTGRGRPQSMYSSYGAGQDFGMSAALPGGGTSFGSDSDRELIGGMAKSSLHDPLYRLPAVNQNLDRSNSRRQDPGPIQSFDRGVPSHASGTSAVFEDDYEDDVTQEIADSRNSRSRRRPSVQSSRDPRKLASYVRDPLIDAPKGTDSLSSKSRSKSRRLYRDDSRTPRQEIRAEVFMDSEDSQGDNDSFRSRSKPIVDIPRDGPGSGPTLRRNSIGKFTSLATRIWANSDPAHQAKERPILERPSPSHQESSRYYTQGTEQGQRQAQVSGRDKSSSIAASKTPRPQPPSNLPRNISTTNAQIKSEPLHREYQVRKSKHFVHGAVFKILWSEPYGDDGGQKVSDVTSDGTSCVEHAKHGEQAYHTTRRFVVVKERDGHSLCVPVLTYRWQGTNKAGVKARHHAVIYTGSSPPELLEGEIGINLRPVRVESNDPREKLAKESRVNYSKVYTVEHNVKVCFIGKIHKDSVATFFEDFRYVDSK